MLAVLVTGLSLFPCLAHADEGPPAIRLRILYDRSGGVQSSCPSEPALLEVFRAKLAAGTVDPDAAASARVVVRPQPGGVLEGRVELIDGEGRQIWSNDLHARFNDCGTLISSLSLSLRVALDAFNRPPPAASIPAKATPSAAARGDTPILVLSTPEPAPPPAAAPRPLEPYHPAAPASESADIGAPASFRLWASAALAIGVAPILVPRFALSMGLHWPSGSFSFEARGVPPVDAHIATYKVVIARWEGVFLPCTTRGRFLGCVSVAAGAFWSEASRMDSITRTRPHVALGMRIGLDLTLLARTAALFFADLEVALLPATVVLDRILWDQPIIQTTVGVALGGIFH